jgi:hypothetical protein
MRSKNFFQKIFLIQVIVGGRSRTAEPWFAGPSSYPLDHEVLVDRIISELPDEVRSRGILKFLKSKSLPSVERGPFKNYTI